MKKSYLIDVFTRAELVPPAEFWVPPLRGFEIFGFAQTDGHFPYLLFPLYLPFLYLIIEDGLHLCVGWTTTSFLSFTSVFPPPKQISTGNPIRSWNLFNIMSVEDLNQFKNYLRNSFFFLFKSVFAVGSSHSVLLRLIFLRLPNAANVCGIYSEGWRRIWVPILVFIEEGVLRSAGIQWGIMDTEL